jgi:glycine cleavage system pyridoxal-binding protein P
VVTTRPFFKEFVVRCPKPPAEINRQLLGHRIIGGYELGQAYPQKLRVSTQIGYASRHFCVVE